MRPRDPAPRSARIDVPALSAREALLLVHILDGAIAAIWAAHCDAMADELALLGVDVSDQQSPTTMMAISQPVAVSINQRAPQH